MKKLRKLRQKLVNADKVVVISQTLNNAFTSYSGT